MLTDRPADLLTALRHTLPHWDHTVDGRRMRVSRPPRGPYRPRRCPPAWERMLATLDDTCADHGVPRARLLPLHGLGDADLTFSAVQALDPYLKHRHRHVHRTGYLPQPVIRFTGRRDGRGAPRPGFATAFINTSIVTPISGLDDHAALIDIWLSVLSRLGFHTSHLTIGGDLTVWHRPPVSGTTLRFWHDDLELGDAVLLWNTAEPDLLATDIGSGLERLRWALTRQPWPNILYGDLSTAADHATLDAVRAATLIVGSGIVPAARGPGSAVRRLLRGGNGRSGGLGFSRVVRSAHHYWSLLEPLPVPWPEVCRLIDAEATAPVSGRSR